MIHVNKLAASMAAAFTMSAAMSCARDQTLNHKEMVKKPQEMVKKPQEMVKHYFAQTLKTKLNAEQNSKADFARNANYTTDIQQQLKDKDVASTQKMVRGQSRITGRETHQAPKSTKWRPGVVEPATSIRARRRYALLLWCKRPGQWAVAAFLIPTWFGA